ncbi:type II secretion system F family protein [Palleronia sp. KMU-117]|uniref:type II secretion system F family protein n=1 Tax=Palleronia sp. KMU-117 TaxID=3434108 RepID=UPI003D7570A2
MFDLQSIGISTNLLILGAVGAGAMLAVVGVAQVMSDKSVAATRIAQYGRPRSTGQRQTLVKDEHSRASEFAAGILADDDRQRVQVQRELARAGLQGPHAVRNFFLFRAGSGLVLPGLFLLLLALAQAGSPLLPEMLTDWLNGLGSMATLIGLALLCYVGYVLPGYWLDRRVAERKWRIEASFPNALDLLQISVEAGLGFDAAMMRVAQEIAPVAPELSEEFMIAQAEIQAGQERSKALMSLANRTGVETIASFVSVVLQSIQFGTPMGEALTTYSREMRIFRELRAQEKANKLPVQMSAVLASFMLPSIVMITLGPVVIRYIRYFAS